VEVPNKGRRGQEMKFEQAPIAVQDEQGFARFHALMDAAFDARDVEVFLSRTGRSKLRIRDFESVVKRGLMGKEAFALYEALPVSDQALTRERYLQQVEAVQPELRQRYFKVYAYY
jgi:hypothetical protein